MQSNSSRRQPNSELGIVWRNSSDIRKALENLILQQKPFEAKHWVFHERNLILKLRQADSSVRTSPSLRILKAPGDRFLALSDIDFFQSGFANG